MKIRFCLLIPPRRYIFDKVTDYPIKNQYENTHANVIIFIGSSYSHLREKENSVNL